MVLCHGNSSCHTIVLVYLASTALTVVFTLQGVVATTLGFFLLGGVPVHLLNVAGIAINTAGGTW